VGRVGVDAGLGDAVDIRGDGMRVVYATRRRKDNTSKYRTMTGAWAAYNRERESSYLFRAIVCRGRGRRGRAEGFTGIRQADQSISQLGLAKILFCLVTVRAQYVRNVLASAGVNWAHTGFSRFLSHIRLA
jgi:hypothetical protein